MVEYNNKEKSVFKKVARIKEEKLDWLKERYPKLRTHAGRLDTALNQFRKITDKK